jgi:hypothetical protein
MEQKLRNASGRVLRDQPGNNRRHSDMSPVRDFLSSIEAIYDHILRTRRSKLHLDRHIGRAYPSQWIENDYRRTVGMVSSARCIDAFRHGRQRPTADLIRRPPHHIIILLRILIDHPNPRPRSQIVELVEQHLLPILRQVLFPDTHAHPATPAKPTSPHPALPLPRRAYSACGWPA